MLQNFTTNVIKGQIILIMWNTVSHIKKLMYGIRYIETKFNEINSYNIFKKQIKQHFLLYTIDNYNKTYDKTYFYNIYM
jgi:hypothetical protein